MLESLGFSSAQFDLLNAIAFQLEIGGSSKTYKTWSGIDLAVSVATGAPLARLRTLYRAVQPRSSICALPVIIPAASVQR